MKRNGQDRIKRLWAILPLLLLTAEIILSVNVGQYDIHWENVWTGNSADFLVFFNLRLARTGMAVLAGVVLGMTGQVFQTVFRNDLAAPDVAGMGGGASVGAAVAILLFGGMMTPVFAFLGGMLAVAMVILMYLWLDRRSMATLVLCGVCVNALFRAVLSVIKVSADSEHTIASIEFWTMGSLAGITMAKFLQTLPWCVVGILGLVILQKPVTMLSLGDDEASMLGVPVKCMRIAALGFSTLAGSAVLAQTGLISFVSLMAPHIAGLIYKDRKYALWTSALLGADLLLLADILARSLFVTELPISVLTGLLGVPALFALLHWRRVHD